MEENTTCATNFSMSACYLQFIQFEYRKISNNRTVECYLKVLVQRN